LCACVLHVCEHVCVLHSGPRLCACVLHVCEHVCVA